MKVALLTPWDNAWVPHFRLAFERRGHTFALDLTASPDVVLHGWSSGHTQPVKGARNIFFLRRYELFEGGLRKVDWGAVDALVVVNAWIKDRVAEYFHAHDIGVPLHLIYNGTDPELWKFRRRAHGRRIGMACHVHPKKNLPLAMQILSRLPASYELHIAGDVQDSCTAEYLNHIGRRLERKVYLYGDLPHAQMNFWWEQMNYCLSTSLSEGNPNNVIEAMAKGIKPIVHDWPGADDQFAAENRFADVSQALAQLDPASPYDSTAYRELIATKFSLDNIERVVDIALQT